MRRRWWPGVVLIIAGLGFPAVGSAQSAYTLDACVQAALQHNEDFIAQRELLLQADERYRQAVAGVLPDVGASAYYLRQDASAGSSVSPEVGSVKITATQPLFQGFREYAALRRTRGLIDAQTETRQAAGLQVYADVARYFYLVLAGQKDLEHIDAGLGLYDQRLRDLQARVRIGRSRPSEVLTVQTARAELKAQKEQADGRLAAARESLTFLTGLAPDVVLSDADAVPEAPESLDAYLARIEFRPDVRAAQKQAQAARENVVVAQGGYWPAVNLTGNYYLQRYGSSQSGVWDAALALNLPLFSGGAVASKVRETESLARQSELELSRTRRSATESLRSLHHTLHADLARAGTLEDALQLAARNYRENLREYNLALVDNQDVLLALEDYQSLQRAVDEARFAVKNDYRQLEAASARRLDLIPKVEPR